LLQVLFDLGCGDGRICLEAAKRFGARARGVEIEEFLIKRFRELIVANDVQELVSVSHGDLLEEDLSEATVIVTYLLPDALDQLAPKLTKLLSQPDKDVRIICNTWGIRGLTPDERVDVGPYGNVTLFVYRSGGVQLSSSFKEAEEPKQT
jgi:ribosomal protein L11 methylase PrmA